MTAAVAGVGASMATGGGTEHVNPPEPAPGSSEGVTPLMYACQQGRDQTVRQILHRKPGSVQERDRSGKTALHYCAENPTLTCIDQVLSADPELMTARDEEGYTPLHLATIAGNRAVVKYLLSRGADVTALDNEKHTVVHWATVCGEVDLLDALIDAGANPSTPDIHGAYPLHYAAQMCGPNSEMGNDVRVGMMVLRKLLQRGVDVTVTDHDGRQPLLWAASAEVRASHVYCPSGSADAILALINAGASVSAYDKDGLTALHCAASRGHLDCLDSLLNFCGAEVDTLDSNGCTPLFYSVTLGHADCTNLLLHHGSDPDKQDRKGRTPAHCGAAKGQLETLKLLHQHEADLWKKNVKGDLPLHEACQSGRRDLVLWLLSMRPEAVNAPNLDGRCPLHIAAINSNVEMCKILMDKQATVNPIMRNSRGQLLTPLDAAVARSNRNCAKYLALHGGVTAAKLTDKHALQAAMQKALESGQQSSTENAGDELLSSSASSVLKSNISTMTASPMNMEVQTDTGDLQGQTGEEIVDGEGTESEQDGKKLEQRDAQESGYSDTLVAGQESDEPTDTERNTDDETTEPRTRRKIKTKGRRMRGQEDHVGTGENGDDYSDHQDVVHTKGSLHARRRKGTRRSGRRGSDPGDDENDDDEEEEEGMDEDEDEEGDADALRKLGVSTHRRPGVRRGRVKSGAMSGGPSKVESMESNMKRKGRKAVSPSTEISITQAMQNTMRKYALERRLFQQLLDLKRQQIRNTRANEHVLIKRMVDAYQKEGVLLGLRGYSGPFNFNSYEKYLYDQLRVLQSTQGVKIPSFRPTDDVDKLSKAIRRAELREIPDPFMSSQDAHTCNHTTHRCHHAAHAYTGVPCAAYIGYRRRKQNPNSSNNNNNNKQVSLPKIPGAGTNGSVLRDSPSHPPRRGRQSHPVGLRNYDPKNPLTVELKPSSPLKHEPSKDKETASPERSASAPESLPSDQVPPSDSTLAPEGPHKELHSAPIEGRIEA